MFPALPCVANRRGAITGRLLEDGTAVVVIEKSQEALAWADYHLAGERLPGVRGEAADEAVAAHAAQGRRRPRVQSLAIVSVSWHQAQRHATAKAAIHG